MAKAMTPVGVIASMVCGELGDNTGANKFLIMQYIGLGFQKMHLFLNHDVVVKTELVCMDGPMRYEVPCGFVYETKVGIRRRATEDYEAGPICVLRKNRNMDTSTSKIKDTEKMHIISDIIDSNPLPDVDCFFYNSPCGVLGGYGSGFHSNNYYSIKDGFINVSPYLYSLGDDLELVIEYKSDGLSEGLKLVPSEAFLALRYFAKAEFKGENQNGDNRLLWEAEWKTLKRLYNRRKLDVLTEILS